MACVFWHAYNRFPDRLVRFSGDILLVANRQVILEYATDIDKHDALQKNKKELARFTEGESDPETSGEEGEEEGTIREDVEITRIESRSPSGTRPQQDLRDPLRGDDGEQTKAGIMRNLGWVEYEPLQCNLVQVAYQADDDTIDTCRWV